MSEWTYCIILSFSHETFLAAGFIVNMQYKHSKMGEHCNRLILAYKQSPVDKLRLSSSLSSALPDPSLSHPEPRRSGSSSALLLLLIPQSEAVTAVAKPRRSHQ